MFLIVESEGGAIAINLRNVVLARLDAVRRATKTGGVELAYVGGSADFFPDGPAADAIREHFLRPEPEPEPERGPCAASS